MKLKQLTVKQSLNKAYRLIKPERADIEKFKTNFKTLLGHINPAESEENMKGHVMDFLKTTWYNPSYHIATKGRTDFVIHTGKDASHPAGVLFEAKKPSNHEMVTLSDLNRKAMHEIILYYLRERIEHRNDNIKYLVITSIYEWFVFDAPQFEKLFYKNKFLVNNYKAWAAKQKVSANNDHFYNEIAKPFIASLADEIEFTYFDIRDYEKPLKDSDKDNDNKLIPLFKILSPTHLLKLQFANDSNSLDKGFYNELLYIIGLEEVKEGNKKLIRRRQEGKRIDGSLLENTIVQLETENCLHKVSDRQSYGETESDQLFSIALELCITWVNRVLFLKLLEAQLLKYHKGNENYRFLNYKTISQYDELYKLFFQVLARKQQERIERVRAKYKHIPYLNSSLFDITALEDQTIRINMLDDAADMPLLNTTILKDDKNKPVAQKLNTLQYLFDFLNAYDFASEGSEEIQEERKTLINAAVLGLIFEKINGYKDGSIYTPGFITMYMCRQSIRQSVVSKFKEKYQWKVETFEDLHNYVSEDRSAKTIKEYNATINSLTICDPAVGSGHFLVSALNELIAIKSELGILADANGKRLADHIATVENDELIVTDKERNFFTYSVNDANEKIVIPNAEVQRVQETLFYEKQSLIENSLFGVDINPKSVQICRLRLWIELLKNAYYIADGSNSNGELQTLPNIDINIKTGNSLVSRFTLSEKLKTATTFFQKQILEYKSLVVDYKHVSNKDKKKGIEQLIDNLKKGFSSKITELNPKRIKVVKLQNELSDTYYGKLFSENLTTEQKKRIADLQSQIDKLNTDLEGYVKSPIYRNAFEWRFEFPEVLDDDGNFIGFDLVIGNPPYGVSLNKDGSVYSQTYSTFNLRGESYVLFIENSLNLLKKNGILSFIIPDTILNLGFTEAIRQHVLSNSLITELNLLPANVFAEAVVDTVIIFLKKKKAKKDYNKSIVKANIFDKAGAITSFEHPSRSFQVSTEIWHKEKTFNLQSDSTELSLIRKVDKAFAPLSTFAEMYSGIKTYEVGKGKPAQTEETRNNKPFTSATKIDDDWSPFFDGKHIGRYELLWKQNNWIKYGQWLAAPRLPENFTGEKILIRKITSDRLIATYIPNTSYCNTLLFVLKLTAKANLTYKALLGILNSSFIGWYFRKKFQISDTDTFPQIMIRDILQFSIPNKSNDITKRIEDLVEDILTTGTEAKLMREHEIDLLVYQLYNLKTEEIAIVEQAQKEKVAVV